MEIQLLCFQEVLVTHSVDSVPIKANILKEVWLGCVGCTMDMQPFFLLREIEAQVPFILASTSLLTSLP